MNTAMEMVDRLRDTTESHDRCSVVEVMGRRCGDIALNTGIAVGAMAILVPEIPFDFDKDIIERMKYTQKAGKKHFIIVVAEGVGGVEDLALEIEKRTGIESRATILGHVQRGGSPPFATVWSPPRWGTARSSFCWKAGETASLPCGTARLWISIFPRRSPCSAPSTATFTGSR